VLVRLFACSPVRRRAVFGIDRDPRGVLTVERKNSETRTLRRSIAATERHRVMYIANTQYKFVRLTCTVAFMVTRMCCMLQSLSVPSSARGFSLSRFERSRDRAWVLLSCLHSAVR